jgi:hypothetical protein
MNRARRGDLDDAPEWQWPIKQSWPRLDATDAAGCCILAVDCDWFVPYAVPMSVMSQQGKETGRTVPVLGPNEAYSPLCRLSA